MKALTLLDSFLNNTTMYRLVTYYLVIILGVAIILSVLGILPYSPVSIILTTGYLLLVSIVINELCGRVIGITPHHESSIITALILALVFGPQSFLSIEYLTLLTVAAGVAQISKYIFVRHKKHLFNPAAVAMVATALLLGSGASWWVGSLWVNVVVLIGGAILLRKIGRLSVVLSFFITHLALLIIFSLSSFTAANAGTAIWNTLLYSPMLFFALVMLIEPQTSPNRIISRILYGSLTAVALYLYQAQLGISYGVELALLTGNAIAYLSEPSRRVVMTLATRPKRIATQTYEFIFTPDRPFSFQPGQYMEWTLPHRKPDSRGTRRYFTISSSPTENDARITVKVPEKPSTFKKTLRKLKRGHTVYANGPGGQFLLPKNQKQRIVFIAGGIGVTPYRSMTRYLLDTGEQRDIILLYAARTPDAFAFGDLFKKAEAAFGMKTVYMISDTSSPVSPHWRGKRGVVDEATIRNEVPDIEERLFYISGPPGMVSAVRESLLKIGVRRRMIKTDFFSGYSEL